MTQDEIIEMARQAGFEIDCCSLEWHKRITAFAKLVHTRGYMDGWSDSDEAKTSESFEMITDAVEAEREACIEACRKTITSQRSAWGANFCIEAIRARGQA
jgi:hypothetical protein